MLAIHIEVKKGCLYVSFKQEVFKKLLEDEFKTLYNISCIVFLLKVGLWSKKPQKTKLSSTWTQIGLPYKLEKHSPVRDSRNLSRVSSTCLQCALILWKSWCDSIETLPSRFCFDILFSYFFQHSVFFTWTNDRKTDIWYTKYLKEFAKQVSLLNSVEVYSQLSIWSRGIYSIWKNISTKW